MRRYLTAAATVVALAAGGLGVAPAAGGLGASPAAADTTPTISVNGQGTVFLAPDVADLTVTVSRSAAVSRQALSAANRTANAIVSALRAAGVPASGIQTEGVDVSARSVRTGKRRVRRWTAVETLAVHVADVRLAGTVIDRATASGASSVSGPSFSFSDPSAGRIAATRAALADARRRADDAAAAIGYTVTGVQSVQLDPQSVPVFAGAPTSAGSSGAGVPTTIHPGTQEVDAQVQVVFTIAPA
jgi:hypothetical protein